MEKKKPLSLAQKIFVGLVFFLVGIVCISYIASETTEPIPKTVLEINMEKSFFAGECIKDWVKRSLKSPFTAKFQSNNVAVALEWLGDGNIKEKMTQPLQENKFRMGSYVDSQNAFGAMIRTEFKCDVEISNKTKEDYTCDVQCDSK